jgi:hypothetical protein
MKDSLDHSIVKHRFTANTSHMDDDKRQLPPRHKPEHGIRAKICEACRPSVMVSSCFT